MSESGLLDGAMEGMEMGWTDRRSRQRKAQATKAKQRREARWIDGEFERKEEKEEKGENARGKGKKKGNRGKKKEESIG